ncbi:kinase-like domain-containing protein [Boeremia exigua]|uniref:kinase-like domain-containing protein n=1 Tax=Boeremia exigua TaxID=749465 RepID=UPI001E8D5FB7|nr:kinase-like domain-containing protein [Boeremia exigua]KAH6643789.1 kinase-like domain-containing protein [Boeremia exigua]
MALAARPNVIVIDDRTIYHSLDAIDQALFDGLESNPQRKKFCEMIHRWREGIQTNPEMAPANGQAIATKWRLSGCKLKKLRRIAMPAVQALPPPVDNTGPPPILPVGHISTRHVRTVPLQSPLAELSPRFTCQSDKYENVSLSPTKGQVEFIAADLDVPWKFADVLSQQDPMTVDRVPLAPPTSVCLFVRTDEDDRIEEHLAVKCLELNELASDSNERLDRKDVDAAVQREIAALELVRSTQCSHVSNYRGHSVREFDSHCIRPGDNDTQMWTYHRKTVHLYQDFAGHGDLKQLINHHRKTKRPINEHFIWYTLRELTEALIALNKGPGHCSKPHNPAVGLPDPDEYGSVLTESWTPILHLDIKTGNVLLETNNAEYPAYPKPVLADFGLSCPATEEVIDLNHTDNTPKHMARFAGTDGWKPPERNEHALIYNPRTGEHMIDSEYEPFKWQLSERTDVWALGLIVHKMMYSHRTDEITSPNSRHTVAVGTYTLSQESDWNDLLRDRSIEEHESHFDVSTANISDLPDVYGVRLCLLAAQCLRHNMEARPGLEQLLSICQQELTRLDNLSGFTAGKRKRNADDDDDDDDEYTVLVGNAPKSNNHTIGETYQPKRPRIEIDLQVDHEARSDYIALIDAWSNMAQPPLASQAALIKAIDLHMLDKEGVYNISGESDDGTSGDFKENITWATKHLVSCLRKRSTPERGAYILTGDYIDEHSLISIEYAFDRAFKVKILDDLLSLKDTIFENESFREQEGGQDAIDALWNAVDWGLMMLKYTVTDYVYDAEGKLSGGEPAEPREPRMMNQSALHKGIHDWIFVRPTGAFYKT